MIQKYFIALFILLPVISYCQTNLTHQQEQEFRDAFELSGRVWDFSSDALKKVNENYEDAIDDCSDLFTMMGVLNKVQEAKDFEAFEAIVLYIEDKLLSDRFKNIFPNAASALNWAGKARAAMQLLIDFVINPALLQNEINQYIARREILLEPDDAVAGIRSWGNIKQQLLAEFRKQYGDLPFKEINPSGLVLLPAWNKKFDEYVTGWFEDKYQDYKLKQFQENARREMARRSEEFQEKLDWIAYLLEKEMQATDFISISPESEIIQVGEQVIFTVTATNFRKESYDVTLKALPNPTFAGTSSGKYSILAEYEGKSAIAQITVEDLDANLSAITPDISELLANADCSGYANTIALWDGTNQEVYCDCLPGYSWLPDYSGCEEIGKLMADQADCSGYPNTHGVWDETTQTIFCDCLPGYVWDPNFTECFPESVALVSNQDCSGYPNTMAVWDPSRNEAYCDCLPGYQWRIDYSGCEQITATQILHADCSGLPNTHQVYDAATDQMYCDCLPGYIWDPSQTGCIPERKKPTIDMNTMMNMMTIIMGTMSNQMPGRTPPNIGVANQQPAVVHQSHCNDLLQAGGDAPEIHQIDLGQTFGTFRFDYETFDVKDEIIISQGGVTIFNSGCVGENRSVNVQFSGYTSVIEVRVNPNCSGTSNTSWNFRVYCPGN